MIVVLQTVEKVKATPHKDRLKALYGIYLQILVLTLESIRTYLAQILLEIRQYYCVEFVQSDEKFADVSAAQSLCGIALINQI